MAMINSEFLDVVDFCSVAGSALRNIRWSRFSLFSVRNKIRIARTSAEAARRILSAEAPSFKENLLTRRMYSLLKSRVTGLLAEIRKVQQLEEFLRSRWNRFFLATTALALEVGLLPFRLSSRAAFCATRWLNQPLLRL